jgi:hypothetical protein
MEVIVKLIVLLPSSRWLSIGVHQKKWQTAQPLGIKNSAHSSGLRGNQISIRSHDLNSQLSAFLAALFNRIFTVLFRRFQKVKVHYFQIVRWMVR